MGVTILDSPSLRLLLSTAAAIRHCNDWPMARSRGYEPKSFLFQVVLDVMLPGMARAEVFAFELGIHRSAIFELSLAVGIALPLQWDCKSTARVRESNQGLQQGCNSRRRRPSTRQTSGPGRVAPPLGPRLRWCWERDAADQDQATPSTSRASQGYDDDRDRHHSPPRPASQGPSFAAAMTQCATHRDALPHA